MQMGRMWSESDPNAVMRSERDPNYVNDLMRPESDRNAVRDIMRQERLPNHAKGP